MFCTPDEDTIMHDSVLEIMRERSFLSIQKNRELLDKGAMIGKG